MLQAVFTSGVDEITVHGLTQWDKGQEIQITLSTLPTEFQVHFGYKGCKEAYAVTAKAKNGIATVAIPNLILQQSKDAVAWIYLLDDTAGETIKTISLPIEPRPKPSDYVYTEVEVLHYQLLEKRLDTLEKNGASDDAIQRAIIEYLKDDDVSRRDRAVNLLDNSWFGNPIAQAGQNGMHGSNKYVCDRWISWDKDATFANGCMTPGSPADQRLDPNMISQTKTYTAAICLSDGTIKAASGTFASGFGSYALGVIGAGTTVPYVRINTGFTVRWAALYEGAYTVDTLPEYQCKGYAAELAECQQYYQIVPKLTHIPGVANSATSFGAKYQIQPMRIAPTVAIPSGGSTSIYTGDYSATTEKYTLQYAAQPNQLTLNVALDAGSFVAYKPGMLVFPVDIALSADL